MSRVERAKSKMPSDAASARPSGTRLRVDPSRRPGVGEYANAPARLGKVDEGTRLIASETPVSASVRPPVVRKGHEPSAAKAVAPYIVIEYVAGERVPRTEVGRTPPRTARVRREPRAEPNAKDSARTRQPEGDDLAGLRMSLDRALSSLWMAYQPIVRAATGSLFGYEALLRSDDPAMPAPGAFLDAAEKLGRVYDVGRAVRSKASHSMNRVPFPALLFVNLHSIDLNDETLTSPASPLTAIASRVVLEITERASLESIDDVPSRVARLRELGFRIAIDDLGAGYSGLTSVALLEPEFVKLDMALIRDIHKNPVKRKLVKSMTTLFKDMGITVVAEGIEIVEERDTIVELGCDLLQGYLVARPAKTFQGCASD
jgi:EAL domain-containing protein (putative c-di-GMP-specific phosphodiesterase class I)